MLTGLHVAHVAAGLMILVALARLTGCPDMTAANPLCSYVKMHRRAAGRTVAHPPDAIARRLKPCPWTATRRTSAAGDRLGCPLGGVRQPFRGHAGKRVASERRPLGVALTTPQKTDTVSRIR
jgi:hypothetical protein